MVSGYQPLWLCPSQVGYALSAAVQLQPLTHGPRGCEYFSRAERPGVNARQLFTKHLSALMAPTLRDTQGAHRLRSLCLQSIPC